MNINVVGGTGQLGARILRVLLKRAVPPEDLIVSVRSPEKARAFGQQGMRVRLADYDRSETLEAAFQETDVLMLIPSMAGVEHRIGQHAGALQAAAAAGVRRIVLTSFSAARADSKFEMAPFYLYAESKLRLSGMEWTILRNGMYLDPVADWAPALADTGRLPYPVQHGRVAYICRDDLARASAAACLESGHAGRLYELTGSESLSMPELASALADATGRPIAFERVSEAEFAAICRSDGVPEPIISILASMYRAVDNGEFETVTDDVATLAGAEPEKTAAYLRRRLRS